MSNSKQMQALPHQASLDLFLATVTKKVCFLLAQIASRLQ